MKIFFRSISSQKFLVFILAASIMACDDEGKGTIEPEEEDPVRQIFTNTLDHPAVWYESSSKTVVNKIEVAAENEVYHFFVTAFEPKLTQLVAQTENGAIREDFTKVVTPDFFVTDINTFFSPGNDPVYFTAGGLDTENVYASESDLDQVALPVPFTFASGISLSNYRASFASLAIVSNYDDFFNSEKRFYAAGNACDDVQKVRPFIASIITKWNIYSEPTQAQINTLTFFDDLTGIQLVKIYYLWSGGIYVLGFDASTQEVVVALYKIIDVNNNDRHDPEDSFEKVWLTRIKDMKVDKSLLTLAVLDDKIFIAGTVSTEKNGEAGKLISLDTSTGAKDFDGEFDYSDDDDGFLGVAASGQNIFAYGYSNRITTGNEVTTSKGWALKLNVEGKALSNYAYAEENAIIEFTAGSGGYDQSNWNERGNFAIGGSRKTSAGFAAFATEFYHNYK